MMKITVLEAVKITGFFNWFYNGNLHRSQSIINEIRKFFFSQKGMYKRYPLKHFGAFIVFIDRAMIEFRKQRLINRGNTITHCHSAPSLPNSKSDNRINEARFDASVGV